MIWQFVIFGGLLFLPAGTLHWPRAWIFIAVVLLATASTLLIVFPQREELLRERLKPPIQQSQPIIDKVLVSLFLLGFFVIIALIPVDVFHWRILMDKPPFWLSAAGLIMFGFGWLLISLAFKENAFAVPVVKYQEERRQTVIDQGVYRVVRHPMYTGTCLLLIGIPLWLESYTATIAAIIPIVTLMIRIHFEEQFLKQNLSGYEAYTQRTRYRLIPFIW